MNPLRRQLIALPPALTIASASFAQSGAFPAKPVKIIVPQTTGGASDGLSRIMAQELSNRWNQRVLVENRAGAGGTIGTDAVAKAPADGYTWLMSYSGTHAINPWLYKNMPFDTLKDLTPVAAIATLPFVLVIHPKVPAKNIAEFVAYAKANPSLLNMASSGNGSVNHLIGEMFNTAAGIKMTHIPYKGAAGALTDLIGGQVQAFVASAPSVIQHIRTGAVRPLAAAATKRAQALSDVPTFGEAGYKALNVDSWFAFFVPSATPASVVQAIHSDINKMLATKEIAEKFAALGADVMSTSLEAFNKVVLDDTEKWGKAVKDSGAKLD
jgi:tripartite-type tricarboxylate transporter receptor subunit TctC